MFVFVQCMALFSTFGHKFDIYDRPRENWIHGGQNFCNFRMATSDWLRLSNDKMSFQSGKNFRHRGSNFPLSSLVKNSQVQFCHWIQGGENFCTLSFIGRGLTNHEASRQISKIFHHCGSDSLIQNQ